VKVIFDNNLSPKIARALNELFSPEHEIFALRDKFAANTSDEDWINALTADGRWVVISGDRRITRNNAEYNAFRNSLLVGFFLARGLYKAKITKQTERILALWENIETLARTVEGGAMFELQIKSHRIRQLRL
jgi:PIN like domain